MTRETQKLYYPTAYSFDRSDIGRIVLFKCEKELALYPFMIIFNRDQKSDEDDDILYRHLLTNEIWTMHDLCVFGYDYVQIVKDTDDV